MEVNGKRIFITLDELKEEVKTGGVQASFTPIITKSTTGVINYVGDLVTKYKKGDKVFVGENITDKVTEVPGVGSYIIITEDSIIAKL